MKIKEIKWQYRRDMRVDLECEHCGHIMYDHKGYDDKNYHEIVIPNIICPGCGQQAPENYRPLTTKYPEGMPV